MNNKCHYCGGEAHAHNWCGSIICLKSAKRNAWKKYVEITKKLEAENE